MISIMDKTEGSFYHNFLYCANDENHVYDSLRAVDTMPTNSMANHIRSGRPPSRIAATQNTATTLLYVPGTRMVLQMWTQGQ